MTDFNGDALSPGAQRLAALDVGFFKFERFLNFIAALTILGLMLVGTFQVLGRKIFNFPIPGYVDIVEMTMAIFAFLGIAYCQRLSGHVRMEIILARFKGRALWLAEIFGTLVAMTIIAILIVYTFEHFLRAWEIGDSTMDIEIPIWPSKLIVPFAFSVLFLRLSLQLAGFIRLAFHPDAVPIAIPKIESVDEIAQKEIDAGLSDDGETVDLAGHTAEAD